VGLLLSDACLHFASKTNKNARLVFGQSLGHFSYFWSVFNLLSSYCSSLPYFKKSMSLNGTRCFGLQISTRSLPCFTALYHLFYVQGIKVIPEDIFNLLSPIAMAHWIMGDGCVHPSGLILCTHSFSIPDCVRLMNVLMIRYRLDCTLQMSHGRPVIYIKAKSMPLLRSIVLPYMDVSMVYKLKL
jgi:hypothetical protein